MAIAGSGRKNKAKCQATPTAETHAENLERNSAEVNNWNRKMPQTIVIDVIINGRPARALLDSGSSTDIGSTRLIDQLGVKYMNLERPIPVQMTVQGSITRIHHACVLDLEYQGIREQHRFDVLNIGSQNYDLILGTPFLFQHQVVLGFNPTRVFIGSVPSCPIEGEGMVEILSSAAEVVEQNIEHIRQQLLTEISDLCHLEDDIELPPLRAINHEIPIIDPSRKYLYRPSKVLEALRPLWNMKRNTYLQSGRWKVSSGSSSCPLFIVPKP
ncbi:hypothetical protein L218DRAFT_878056, partial [Marasmius fiardii PR-910]